MSSKPPVHPGEGQLLQVLGVGFGIAVTIGGIVGIGIFRNPGIVAGKLGSHWLILLAWFLGGVLSLLGANYLAELGTMIPAAGGPYIFAQRAFGNYVGFVVGWNDWFMNTASIGFLTIAAAEYLPPLVPATKGQARPIAIAISIGLFVINWIGTRSGSATQKVSSALKAAGLLFFVGACFLYGGGRFREAAPVSSGTGTFIAGFVVAVQAIISTYAGWNIPVYFTEEDEDPGKNLPKSLAYGIILVIVLYLLVNAGLMCVLSVKEIAASNIPGADAAQLIFGTYSGKIFTVLAVVSLFSISNAAFMQCPRILLGLSRDNLFVPSGLKVNAAGTPTVGLLVTTVVAVILIATGTYESLIAIFSFLFVAVDLVAVCAFFALRKSEPNLARPFKAWGYPWLPLLLVILNLAICVAFVIDDLHNSLMALIPLAISWPAYLFVRRRNSSAR